MSSLNYKSRSEKTTDEPPHLRAVSCRRPVQVAPAIRQLTPYVAVTSQAAIDARPDGETTFKLDWNESTIAPSPRVNEALMAYLNGSRDLNWYPQLGSTDLIDALEGYTGLSGAHLLATNGSDDALQLICNTYLSEGDHVVAPVPTYNHFLVFAESRGAQITTVCGEDPFATDIDLIHDAMGPHTRILYLVSPNNPTGKLMDPADVEALCLNYPETLIILDEAYFEFAQVTGMDLVGDFPNLIVTRTFSKAFGLASMRVGYLATDPAIIEGLSRIYNPKSVNTLGQVAAIAALSDLDYLNNYLDEVSRSKEILGEFFAARGVEAYITPANFVVVRAANLPDTLGALEERGVYVRDRSSYPGLEGCLRMSVGTVEQTERLLERIAEVF